MHLGLLLVLLLDKLLVLLKLRPVDVIIRTEVV